MPTKGSVTAIPTTPLLTSDARLPSTTIAAKADVAGIPAASAGAILGGDGSKLTMAYGVAAASVAQGECADALVLLGILSAVNFNIAGIDDNSATFAYRLTPSTELNGYPSWSAGAAVQYFNGTDWIIYGGTFEAASPTLFGPWTSSLGTVSSIMAVMATIVTDASITADAQAGSTAALAAYDVPPTMSPEGFTRLWALTPAAQGVARDCIGTINGRGNYTDAANTLSLAWNEGGNGCWGIAIDYEVGNWLGPTTQNSPLGVYTSAGQPNITVVAADPTSQIVRDAMTQATAATPAAGSIDAQLGSLAAAINIAPIVVRRLIDPSGALEINSGCDYPDSSGRRFSLAFPVDLPI